ncbi:hypothetical protein BDN72DRAFT_849449 [Pluteus cervinus]|uniref:Uncharacterized protein n=1 Tax=Pluteus cervinus TaxID=181527 RepID=A0ACD3A8H6_9AGAR|nr:hypothetical protein BDN72DRAFT_849449 [Pluteus cervinus]
MTDSSQPIFPPELEEVIFLFALQDDLKLVGTLVLVAKRVHDWVIPRFYEVVIFRYASEPHIPHRSLSLQHLAGNGKHVRHLLLHDHSPGRRLDDHFSGCIDRCPNLCSLGLWIPDNSFTPGLVGGLLRLRLKYLSFDISGLVPALEKQGVSTVLLPTVTHLELIGATKVDPHLVKSYFPALTHLALTGIGNTPITVLRDALDVFGDQLEVAIWYLWNAGDTKTSPRVERTSKYIIVDDPRFVVLRYGANFANTWHEGVKGGLGIWKAAEEAVQARRLGTIVL